MMKEDKVYSVPREKVDAFEFDGQVADVFENMISRSVPGYPLLLDLLEVLQSNSRNRIRIAMTSVVLWVLRLYVFVSTYHPPVILLVLTLRHQWSNGAKAT